MDLPPGKTEQLIRNTGFGFLFAPIYHGAMRYAAVPRRELGIKTMMNLLGPLVNPAGASYQLIGVYSDDYVETVARAAHLLGIKRVMVVHGFDGIDELSVSAPSRAVTVDTEGRLTEQNINPEQYGMVGHSLSDLAGGSATVNAAIAQELLDGRGPDAIRDSVTLNAAAALAVYGTAQELGDGVELARGALADGTVARFVRSVIAESNRLANEAGEDAPGAGR